MKTKLFLVITIIVFISIVYYFYNERKPNVVTEQLDSQGLEWTDDISGLNGYVNFNAARSYCISLSSIGGLKSNTAWRLPTKNELLQLYREVHNGKSAELSTIGYWSSENYNDDTKMETVVNGSLENTAAGYFGSSKEDNDFFSARCVR